MTQPQLLVNLYQEEIYKIKSKVMIVINKPWSEITEEEIVLLQKILTASKLSLASIHIISRKEFSVEELKIFLPSIIIGFGAALKNSESMYQRLLINGTTVVMAHELHELDEARKRNLWATLKQVFHS